MNIVKNGIKSLCCALTGLSLLGASLGVVGAPPGWPEPVEDNMVFSRFLLDQFEYRFNRDAQNTLNWDFQGWVGTDYNKLWVKTEGADVRAAGAGAEGELQVLYSRMIAPFWDLQAGLRYDRLYGGAADQDRSFAVVGVQGLAPYRFELEPALFISEEGDVSARLVGSYDLLLSQRLILQPRLQSNLAAQAVDAFGVGKGLNTIDLDLRLRYEIKREFAPYVGVSWSRKFGDTADRARVAGEDVRSIAGVMGLRLWF